MSTITLRLREEDGLDAARVDRARLDDAVARLNRAMGALDIKVEFEVRDGHRIVVRVLDAETKQVIREIPPTAVLDVVEGLRRLIGLLYDDVA